MALGVEGQTTCRSSPPSAGPDPSPPPRGRPRESVDPDSVTYRRGEADGRRGHPPAELTLTYLAGYQAGLEGHWRRGDRP